MFGGHGFFGGFMWLFWILLIVVIVWAVRGLGGGPSGPQRGRPDRTPLEILEERFARGEIDEEEFRRRKRLLGG